MYHALSIPLISIHEYNHPISLTNFIPRSRISRATLSTSRGAFIQRVISLYWDGCSYRASSTVYESAQNDSLFSKVSLSWHCLIVWLIDCRECSQCHKQVLFPWLLESWQESSRHLVQSQSKGVDRMEWGWQAQGEQGSRGWLVRWIGALIQGLEEEVIHMGRFLDFMPLWCFSWKPYVTA